MRAGVQALQTRRQLGQAIEQRGLVGTPGAAHGLGQRGQLGLALGQPARHAPRHRQAQQRRHPVGFDLQHALHQPAQPARRDGVQPLRTCQQQHPHAAILAQAQVGVQIAAVADHARAGDHPLLAKQLAHQRRRALLRLGQGPQMHAGQRLAGHALAPGGGHQLSGGGRLAMDESDQLVGRQGARHGPRHVFGVQLPAQGEGAQLGLHEGGLGRRCGQAGAGHQIAQILAAGRTFALVDPLHPVRDGQGRSQRLRRARVQLLVQGQAQFGGQDIGGFGHGRQDKRSKTTGAHCARAKKNGARRGAASRTRASVNLRRRPPRGLS